MTNPFRSQTGLQPTTQETMAAPELPRHDLPESLTLPPAATPSSPLDDRHDDRIPSVFVSSNAGFYTPQQHQSHSQSTIQQPLIPSRTPFSETASITPSIATTASSYPPTLPPTSTPAPKTSSHHPNHPSEESYLAALRAWADEQQYVQLGGGTLEGFYGHEELQERAQRMTEERRLYKEGKARVKAARVRERELQGQRRGTVAGVQGGDQSRRGSVAKFFRRQSAAV